MGNDVKFYYDKREFPKVKFPFTPVGEVVDTRFNNFVGNLFDIKKDYLAINFPSDLISEFLSEKVGILSLVSFGKHPNKSDLKNIFSSIFSNKEGLFPYLVSCDDRKDYFLIEEVFKEKGINKKLSSGILGSLSNKRLIS